MPETNDAEADEARYDAAARVVWERFNAGPEDWLWRMDAYADAPWEHVSERVRAMLRDAVRAALEARDDASKPWLVTVSRGDLELYLASSERGTVPAYDDLQARARLWAAMQTDG